jgi:hypothetical protein
MAHSGHSQKKVDAEGVKARPFLLLVSQAFLERHMEGEKKIKIKLYFPTSQKCLHQISERRMKKNNNLF